MPTVNRPLQAIAAAPIDTLQGRRLLVLLHGYGADERDLLPIAAGFGDAVISLRGPVTLDGGGAAWADGPREDILAGVGVDSAADDVLAWLDAVPQALAAPSAVRLLGFSQGGAVALSLLRRHPDRFDRIVVLAGFVTAEGDGARVGTPVFWGRGEADTVIPPDAVTRTAAWLATYADATVRTYPGLGHGVSPEEVSDVAEFLASDA